jgi:hypothetical protein
MVHTSRFVFLLGLLSALCSCSAPEPGLEIEVVCDVRDAGRLSALQFQIQDIQVQPAGYEVTADHQVTAEWIGLELLVDSFDVLARQSEPLTVARANLPPGRYDRIFLRPKLLTGLGLDNEEIAIENVMEPTVISFEMAQGDYQLLRLELIVLESLDGEARLSIFAKNVTQLN